MPRRYVDFDIICYEQPYTHTLLLLCSIQIYVMYEDHQGPLRIATEYFTDFQKQLVIPKTWADTARRILESSRYSDGTRPDVPVKMEIRYVHRNMFGHETKYRTVVYEGDAHEISIPPVRNDCPGTIEPPIIQCMLMPSDNGTEDEPRKQIDITKRLLKYMGPNRDFGPSALKVFELFPFDDPDQFRESFRGIQVTDLCKNTVLGVDDVLS